MPRFPRALVLSTCLYSFLLWAYIVLRIIVNRVNGSGQFINGIPVSFWVLGSIAFVISYVSMLIYLTFWGFSSDG